MESTAPNLVPDLCHAETSHLIVVDTQTRLAASIPQFDRERCFNNMGLLLDSAALLEVPVAATEQYPDGLGATDSAIATRFPEHTPVFVKTSFSCCGTEGFMGGLDIEVRAQVVLIGMEAHVCVLQTAMELSSRGFQVFVVEDAVCSRHAGNINNAMARLRQTGIIVSNSESVVFEWLRDSRHERFREVSDLLKRYRPPSE